MAGSARKTTSLPQVAADHTRAKGSAYPELGCEPKRATAQVRPPIGSVDDDLPLVGITLAKPIDFTPAWISEMEGYNHQMRLHPPPGAAQPTTGADHNAPRYSDPENVRYQNHAA